MVFCEDDIDEGFIVLFCFVVVIGIYLSNEKMMVVVIKVFCLVCLYGVKIVLDIDYCFNLWGVVGYNDGESCFVESVVVIEKL